MHPDKRRAGRAIRKRRRRERGTAERYRALMRRADEIAARINRAVLERAIAVLHGDNALESVEWREAKPMTLAERARALDAYQRGTTPDAP